MGAALADDLRPTTVLENSLLLITEPLLFRVLASIRHPPPHTHPYSRGAAPVRAPKTKAHRWLLPSGIGFLSCLLFLYLQHSDEGLSHDKELRNAGDQINKDQLRPLDWALKVSLVCGMGDLPNALLYSVLFSLPMANCQVASNWFS